MVNYYSLKTLTFLSLILLVSCGKNEIASLEEDKESPPPPVVVPHLSEIKTWLTDKSATNETASLFYNLKTLSETFILFGHQDATKRGVINAGTQWANEEHLPSISPEKSDVKEITGAYPGVYGHDFIHIANFVDGNWFDYEAKIARELTIDAYNRGGVNTYGWHYANPVSKDDFYWEKSPIRAVDKILPGGSHHEVYKQSLKEVADFAKSLIGGDGKLVPIIFRPFHEFDGDWFWWGKSHCTAAEYKQLYQFTVTYLRDDMDVHNFLYAWSPDKNFNSEVDYLERYPGDDYVDLLGTDNYGDLATKSSIPLASKKLKIVSDVAVKKNKLAALTETGLQNLPQSDWYTESLLKALQSQKVKLAFVLVWANTINSFWTPYKGHPAESDFIKFKNNPYILFGDKMPSIYKMP